MIDIAADAGKGFGLFDHIGDCSSGREFSESLLRATEQYFGTAALTYLGCLTADVPGVTGRLKSNIDAFVKEHANDSGGQVERVAKRFGLLAACGELATEWGILPWNPGEATGAARRCFLEWLEARGTRGPAEIERGIEQVRRAIERDGAARFVPWSQPSQQIVDRLGFMRPRSETEPGTEG